MDDNSKNLEVFLDFIAFTQKEYDYCYRNVNNCDKATQDLLHELELGETKSRAKTATKLSNTRKVRRQLKDYVEICQPLIDWISSDEGKKSYEKLKKVLGEMRKQEKSKVYRTYNPKIIKNLEFLEKRENT